MQTITAVLAMVAASGALFVLVVRVAAPTSAVAGVARAAVDRRAELTLAIATVATLGSLYFSEIADYVPCRLCWFQRIAMYPIAVVALVGLLRRDAGARFTALALAAVGILISGYHVTIEQGWVADSESCALFGPSCADVWFETFGFVTLATMAFAGFVSIVVLNSVSFPIEPPDRQEPHL